MDILRESAIGGRNWTTSKLAANGLRSGNTFRVKPWTDFLEVHWSARVRHT